MRNILKTALYSIAFLARSVARIFQRDPEVTVLMYHAVDDSGWKHAIPPTVFWKQIDYLRGQRAMVSLADVVAHARGETKLTKHSVALTFDDGYYGLMQVMPRLLELGIPFTLFVPSDTTVPTNSARSRRMTWDDIRPFANNPLVTIAAHGRTHRKLTQVPHEEIKGEIEGCIDDIEAKIGKRPFCFAYPYGDKNAAVVHAVREAGYEAAYAITEGTIQTGDDLFILKRVQVDRTVNFSLFCMRLTRAVDIHQHFMRLMRNT